MSYSDVQLNIVRQGFTVYDSNQNFAFVQIECGKDEVNVTGVEIGFNFDGTTKTYQSDNVPTPNGKYTYKFNFTNDSEFGIPEDVAPDKVTVAPIFTINNKERLGKILDEKPMPSGRIHLSAEAWKKANDEAAIPIVVSTGSGGGDEPGEEVEPEPTGPSIVCNAQNNSAYDNGTLIDECSYGCEAGACLEETCEDYEIEYKGICAIKINSSGPFILDQEGRSYVLTENVNSQLSIRKRDIVLDGNLFEVIGDGSGHGIVASEVSGIVVKNFGEIGNFVTGIYFDDVSGSVIENNSLEAILFEDTSAISLTESISNTIYNNQINWQTYAPNTVSKGIVVSSAGGNNNITNNSIYLYSVYAATGIEFSTSGVSNSNSFVSNFVSLDSSYGSAFSFDNQVESRDNIINFNKIELGEVIGNGFLFMNWGSFGPNTFQGNSVCGFSDASSSYGIACFGDITFGFPNALANKFKNPWCDMDPSSYSEC